MAHRNVRILMNGSQFSEQITQFIGVGVGVTNYKETTLTGNSLAVLFTLTQNTLSNVASVFHNRETNEYYILSNGFCAGLADHTVIHVNAKDRNYTSFNSNLERIPCLGINSVVFRELIECFVTLEDL